MKKNIGLICVLIGILLFVYKTAYCAKPESLPWQCNMAGYNKVEEAPGGGFDCYFTTPPGTGCIYNYGFGPVDSIKVLWSFYTEDCGSTKILANPSDTVKFLSFGMTFVLCKAIFYRKDKPNAESHLENICVNGSDDVDCPEAEIVAPPVIDTTAQQIDTTVVTPPILPENSLTIENGTVTASGQFGILKVFAYPDFTPIAFVEFFGSLSYSLRDAFGIGRYYVETLFTNPSEDIPLGVVEIY